MFSLLPSSCSAQESHYFSHSKVVQIGEMEKYLEEHPQDVEAWLSLVEDMGKSFGDDEAGVTAAIKSEWVGEQWFVTIYIYAWARPCKWLFCRLCYASC